MLCGQQLQSMLSPHCGRLNHTCRGYGMVCLSPVAEGQELVSVPRRLLMTADTARQAAECGRLVQETGLTEWQVRAAGEAGHVSAAIVS